MNTIHETVQRKLRDVLKAALGPSLGGALVSKLVNWIRSSGVEWAVSRLKAFMSIAKQTLANNPDSLRLAISICEENGIAYRKICNTICPRGEWGVVIRRLQLACKPSVMRRLFAVLRCYTALILSTTSESQLKKTRDAISGSFTGKVDYVSLPEVMLEAAWKRLNLPDTIRVPVPNLARLKSLSSYHRNMATGQQPWSKLVGSLLSSTYLPESLKDINPNEKFRAAFAKVQGADDTTPGHLSILQEGGAKARVVAVPNAWCQWMFEPLHHSLSSVIKTLKSSCMHDQLKGALYMLNHMGTSHFWCYDLSSATDRYPIEAQLQVLDRMGLFEYADAFHEISKAKWDFEGTKLHYEVGQPMGLYGSFPLFHLTQIIRLEAFTDQAIYEGYEVGTRPYMVLGDDVIITHHRVAQLYADDLAGLGVTISPTKSILSWNVAEFAGFLCVKTGKPTHPAIFRPYKFGTDRIKNPINLMFSLGSTVRFIGKWYGKNYPLFVKTTGQRHLDLSPLISGKDDERGKTLSLDSYLLGSHVTRLSYQLAEWPEELDSNALSRAYQVFLGNSEVCSTGSYAAPLRVQSGISLTIPVYQDENKTFNPASHWSSDPLIREVKSKADNGSNTHRTVNKPALSVTEGPAKDRSSINTTGMFAKIDIQS